MNEKKLKTSEAHRKASVKWQKNNYSRIPLDVRKEYHEYLKARAASEGMTLGAWIKDAIERKATCAEDEIPDNLLNKAFQWLKDHGHSDSEILDFLQYVSAEDNQGRL